MIRTILWRRIDAPGHDAARFDVGADGVRIEGAAVLLEGARPCRLDYAIDCDASWRTRSARLAGWHGDVRIEHELRADSSRRWTLNGVRVPAVDGCIDVDLAFTPATNTLPIRRLAAQPGGEQPVRAAWLRFPELDLVPLEQTYRRFDATRVRYSSRGGSFVRDLDVDAHGVVVHYPGLWIEEHAEP